MIEPEKRHELEAESSLFIWYPRIRDKIPTPRTAALALSDAEIQQMYTMVGGKPLTKALIEKINTAIRDIPFPLFLRTDQASGKHDWKDTCFVKDRTKLFRHIRNLVQWHSEAGIFGLNFSGLVFREYLPLQSTFTAFNGMPVAPEWRFFVRNGKIVCRHFYWPEDAIRNPSTPDWKIELLKLRKYTPGYDRILSGYAKCFARNNPGYWSVDFALTKKRGWVLIDAARGEVSWHPEDCPECPEEQKKPPQIISDLADLGKDPRLEIDTIEEQEG